jgi:hypothetical protein
MVALLSLIMQKQKFRIIVDPTNAVFEGDTENVNAHMPNTVTYSCTKTISTPHSDR